MHIAKMLILLALGFLLGFAIGKPQRRHEAAVEAQVEAPPSEGAIDTDWLDAITIKPPREVASVVCRNDTRCYCHPSKCEVP